MNHRAVILMVLILAAGTPVAAQPKDDALVLKPGTPMTALETPDWAAGCEAWAVNERDEIVGLCQEDSGDESFEPMPVLWIGGIAVVLDGPVLVSLADGSEDELPLVRGIAVGINDAGIIAGQITPSIGPRAATWDHDAAAWRALPIPAGSGFPSASARGINARGDVVGTARGHAVIWEDGEPALLSRPSDSVACIGYAVNNAREATGVCVIDEGADLVHYAMFWDRDGKANLISEGLPLSGIGDGELGATFGRAINSSGAIAGMEANVAMIWSGGDAIALAAPGAANGIDSRGNAVGYVGINGGEIEDAPRATLWPRDGVGVDLGTLGGGTSFARAISERGVVVGLAEDSDGVTRAFALRAR